MVRTERRRRRSASLPCLSLLSPRDAIRIPIPSGPRCLRASALGPSGSPSVRPSVAVYLSLSVARRAVATLLTDQSESGGPAARDRERLMQLPVVSPSSPPSLLLLLASLVVFVVIVHCERRLCKRRVRARSAAMPFTCTRANSPSERTIPAVAVSVLGSRPPATPPRAGESLTHYLVLRIYESSSLTRPRRRAVHCQCHMHRRSRTVARTDSSNGIGHPTVVACTALPSTSAVESQAGARHAPKT